MTVYFTSDLHLGHYNMIIIAERPFEGLDEMNDTLIANINERVGEDDTLWILGDASCYIGRDEAEQLLRQINCKDLRLLRGNHDVDWSDSDLFQEVCDYKELKLDGRRVCLMHYPLFSWNGMYRGSVHLHGHSHNKPEFNQSNIEEGRLLWDVGVDANDYRPISWEEISDALLPVVEEGE